MRKVLYVAHNHLVNSPGGVETYAHELYQAVREAGELEPILVSRAGLPHTTDPPHEETRFALVGHDPNQYLIHTKLDELDTVMWAAPSKELYTMEWRSFLDAVAPDVVHFHQVMFLGYDMIRETRNVLPNVPIVYTLHGFLPICHNSQMVRTGTSDLCGAATPRRCHTCFPKIPAETFFLRERFVKSAFELVDLFIAPSRQLRERYIEWGIPAERIRYEEYGRITVLPSQDPPDAGRRRRIGFFGQITETKGVDVLLEAMKILQHDDAGIQLLLCGANLDFQPAAFRERVARLLEEMSDSVSFRGSYAQAELPALMSAVDWVVVPSIWWENSPLVIQEAMMHRRPVICSDIGGMAEKVRDGVNGLHFRVRDPYSLADVVRRAVDEPLLWDSLRAQLTGPHPMVEHRLTLTGIYDELLADGAKQRTAA